MITILSLLITPIIASSPVSKVNPVSTGQYQSTKITHIAGASVICIFCGMLACFMYNTTKQKSTGENENAEVKVTDKNKNAEVKKSTGENKNAEVKKSTGENKNAEVKNPAELKAQKPPEVKVEQEAQELVNEAERQMQKNAARSAESNRTSEEQYKQAIDQKERAKEALQAARAREAGRLMKYRQLRPKTQEERITYAGKLADEMLESLKCLIRSLHHTRATNCVIALCTIRYKYMLSLSRLQGIAESLDPEYGVTCLTTGMLDVREQCLTLIQAYQDAGIKHPPGTGPYDKM